MGCRALFDLVTCRQTTFDFLLETIQILPMRGGFLTTKERNAHWSGRKLHNEIFEVVLVVFTITVAGSVYR